MRLRTYLLLLLTFAAGTGIAVFSMYADGMYSAVCLFFFPFLSLAMFASIAYDIARPRAGGIVLLDETPRGTMAADVTSEATKATSPMVATKVTAGEPAASALA